MADPAARVAARKIGGGFMELPSVVGVDRADGSVRAVDRAVDKATGPGLPLRLGRCFMRERYEGTPPSLRLQRLSEGVRATGDRLG